MTYILIAFAAVIIGALIVLVGIVWKLKSNTINPLDYGWEPAYNFTNEEDRIIMEHKAGIWVKEGLVLFCHPSGAYTVHKQGNLLNIENQVLAFPTLTSAEMEFIEEWVANQED